MPTPFTHAVIAAGLGQAGAREWRSDWRFWCVAVFCAVLPDIDVLGFLLGINYHDLWGHRGMTHSLLFAAIVAAVMTAIFWRHDRKRWTMLFLLFAITASHGIFDAMTDGGLGIAFFSPFDTRRYFFLWRPIHVSPIRAGRFFSNRGWYVLSHEMLEIWIPVLIVSLCVWLLRRKKHQAVAVAGPQ
jgi:inner membrane protein